MKISVSPAAVVLGAALIGGAVWIGRTLYAGQVTHLSGSGRLNGAPLAIGAKLRAGDQLELDPGSTAAARFLFRAAIKLTDAKVVVQSAGKGLGFDLRSGSLMSSVRPGGKFRVKTPLAAASVRGTEFFVNAGADGSYICACRGRIVLESGTANGELASENHSAVGVKAASQVEPDTLRLHSDEDVKFVAALLNAR